MRAGARRGAAAALPVLPRAARRRRRPVRRLLVEAVLIDPPYCARLGIPFVYDPGPGLLSMEAIADPPAYDRARAAVRYDDVARALVHALQIWRPARSCADDGPLDGARRPRAPRRRRRPGPGAAALAAAMGAALQPVGDARRRDRRRAGCRCSMARSSACARRRSRSGCPKTERADNVQGAFRVPPEEKAEVAGRRLVLIDDVLTSGATVDTCARALLRAGAAHVDVLVFARVVAPVRTPI